MEDDIEKIKKRKLQEIKSQMADEEAEEEQKKELEKKKKQLLRKILTSDARSRLSNLRMAKPEFTEQVEIQLIQIARTGRVDIPINDDQLRSILKKLQENKKSINIERR